jgi:hypothetical protein
MTNFISEKIIEDILSVDKSILAEVLSVDASGLSLIARQKKLSSGRLDLLYLYESDLLLIELKVVPFYEEVITQTNNYFGDLQTLQKAHKLINANIKKIILVTRYTLDDALRCKTQDIQLLAYDPTLILVKYYENFKELSYFLKIQSGDYGVVRIGLIKSTLELLSKGNGLHEISRIENRSSKTIRNRLSIAIQLGLVTKYKDDFLLTDFGNRFVTEGEENISDRLNDVQVEMLADFVVENPFYSSVTYTILTFLESAFVLAKSTYPVSSEVIQDYFIRSAGKTGTWKMEKSRKTASYIFSNYACELELLSSVDNHFYITPKGIQAILLLQLNRSIKLIESQY